MVLFVGCVQGLLVPPPAPFVKLFFVFAAAVLKPHMKQ